LRVELKTKKYRKKPIYKDWYLEIIVDKLQQ